MVSNQPDLYIVLNKTGVVVLDSQHKVTPNAAVNTIIRGSLNETSSREARVILTSIGNPLQLSYENVYAR